MRVHKQSDIKIGKLYKTDWFGEKVLYMGVGQSSMAVSKQMVIVMDDTLDCNGNIGRFVIPNCSLYKQGFIEQD